MPGQLPDDQLSRATALHRRGMHAYASGRFDLAGRVLARALGLLATDEQPGDGSGQSPAPDPRSAKLRVRLMMTLSTVEFERGDRQSGEARLRAAHDAADQIGSGELSFAISSLNAFRTLRGGQHERALNGFAQAERNVAWATHLDAAVMYLNRGNLRMQRLELDQARRDLERSVDLATHPGGETDEDTEELERLAFKARHNLGYLEFLAGNLPRSLRLMDEAAQTPADVSLGISALDRARVLIEAGLSDAAEEVLVAAEKEFRRGRLQQELAETELARAEGAILADNLTRARALAASARNRFRRRGNDRWRRVAELTLLAADQADGRPAARLIAPAERLAREFAAEGLELQSRSARLIMCAALIATGHTGRAEEQLREIHPLSRRDPITVRLQQRAVAASLLSQTGRMRQARTQVRTGLTELSRHQAQFGSIDLQTAGAVHGRRLVALDLELALVAGRPSGLFAAIERGRAVSRRLTAVTPPTDESAAQLAELRMVTEQLKMVGDDPDTGVEARRMRSRSAELLSELKAISWRAVGVNQVIRPEAMNEVAEAAEDQGKAVVSFCHFEHTWWAVVLGKGRPRLLRLPGDAHTVELVRRAQADLNVLALGSIPAPLQTAARGSLTAVLAALDELLLAPLRLGDQPLAIVPTGPTSTLPWGCLPSLRGRPVEVAPSASSWLWGSRAVDRVGDVQVASFSGPGLASAEVEAAEVDRLWEPKADRSRLFRGAGATRARMADALATDTVVHVAAHGTHMRQNPLFSSLLLADGPLYAYEIAGRHVPGHVVLSACELGQSTNRAGDEALGWTRVLLQLGSQCVVAGVAQVNDQLAGRVMADYHARLAAGDDSATALAAATAAADELVPFVCFGSSWRAVPPVAPLPASTRAVPASG